MFPFTFPFFLSFFVLFCFVLSLLIKLLKNAPIKSKFGKSYLTTHFLLSLLFFCFFCFFFSFFLIFHFFFCPSPVKDLCQLINEVYKMAEDNYQRQSKINENSRKPKTATCRNQISEE